MSKVKRIAPGAVLGFVGSSGAVADVKSVEDGARAARAMGYRVKLTPSCTARYGYLSGTDEQRAQDLNALFADDTVDAVVCTRGGYGTPRLLDRLDYDLIGRARKPLLGYSDITGLHLAIYARCGLAMLHGPMPTVDWISQGFEGFTRDSMTDCLADAQVGQPLENPPGVAVFSLKPGVAQGVLVGGNLSLVCALMGTDFMPDLRGKLLLLEDVDERLYRVDRMLTQLRLAGAFSKCAGVVLGTFTNCDNEYADRALCFDEIVSDCILRDSAIPVLSGLMIGHCTPKITLPLGVRYQLDACARTLTPLESPFA